MLSYDKAFPDGGFEDMRRRVPSTEKIRKLTKWQPQRSLNQILTDVIADRRTALRA
jgi:nucleoside-diphosphate-sugar epimerase